MSEGNDLARELERLRAQNARLQAQEDAYREREAALQARLELYQRLIAHVGDVVYQHHFATRTYLHIDEGIEALTGIRAQEMTLDHWGPMVEEAVMRGVSEGLTEREASILTEAGKMASWDAEYRIHARDGKTRWLWDSSVSVYGPEGKAVGSFGILRDITARRQAEERTKRHEQLLEEHNQALNELSRSGVWERRGLRAALEEILQVTARTLSVARAGIWLYAEDQASLVCPYLYIRSQERHTTGQEYRRADYPAYFQALEENRVIVAHDARTDPRTREFSADPLTPDSVSSMLDAPIRVFGRTVGVVCQEHIGPPRNWTPEEEAFAGSVADFVAMALEAEERRQVEAALRASEERFRVLIERSTDIITVLDADGIPTFVSPSATETLGYTPDEIAGRSVFEFIHPEDVPTAMQIFEEIVQGEAGGGVVEMRIRHRDGSWHICEVIGRNLFSVPAVQGVVINARDITERRLLEEQLLQAQKLESLGRLAGGVAHDFNNLLTAILGYADLAKDSIEPQNEAQECLTRVRKAGERAAELTGQLLAFARKQIIAPKVVSLNAVLRDVYSLLQRIIGEHIEILAFPDPALWAVRVDPGQFEQVLFNLAVNARDAMPSGGRLVLETQNVTFDADYARMRPEVTPGDYVMLAVSDTGSGMDETIQKHVFEPFFTTKEMGKGTGLGLATCHGIVKQNGGHIWLYSEPGQGTTFKIYLPRVQDEVAAVEAPKAVSAPRGTETLLLVEDEPLVRDLVHQALTAQGYTVLIAGTGQEALQVAHDHPGGIHLLVTDVVMPQMSGGQLAERLLALRPALKVLYMSGYTEDRIVHHGVLEPGVAFLQKPYLPAELASKVRAVLDTGGAQEPS